MPKYHISPMTGRPNVCTATVRGCPLGGEAEHYATKEDALQAYEKQMSEQTFSTHRKEWDTYTPGVGGNVSDSGPAAIAPPTWQTYSSSRRSAVSDGTVAKLAGYRGPTASTPRASGEEASSYFRRHQQDSASNILNNPVMQNAIFGSTMGNIF